MFSDGLRKENKRDQPCRQRRRRRPASHSTHQPHTHTQQHICPQQHRTPNAVLVSHRIIVCMCARFWCTSLLMSVSVYMCVFECVCSTQIHLIFIIEFGRCATRVSRVCSAKIERMRNKIWWSRALSTPLPLPPPSTMATLSTNRAFFYTTHGVRHAERIITILFLLLFVSVQLKAGRIDRVTRLFAPSRDAIDQLSNPNIVYVFDLTSPEHTTHTRIHTHRHGQTESGSH